MPVFNCECVKSFDEQRFSIIIIINLQVVADLWRLCPRQADYLCDLNKILIILIIAQECRPGWA